jgi:DnaJ family protein C protein 9
MPSRHRSTEDDDLEIEEAPTSIDPYTTLNLDKTATNDQIRSAYRKAALKHHPDKAPPSEKETAHTKFQEIAFAYAILSDERRRKRYDVTGRTEESLDGEDGEEGFDWVSFYREQFRNAVTFKAIEAFAEEYRGSEEEREVVLEIYTKYEGKMEKLYQNVMLSDPAEDEERFRAIIDHAIKEGAVQGYKNYTEEPEKKRLRRVAQAKKRKEKEAKETEKHAADLGIMKKGKARKEVVEEDLAALIQQRQKVRAGDFLADLEAKYAPKGKARSKRSLVDDEPSEEAFVKTEAGRKSKRSKKA